MFYSPIEEQVRFAIEDHERLCRSLQLERAARKAAQAAREEQPAAPLATHRGWRGFMRTAASRMGTVHPW